MKVNKLLLTVSIIIIIIWLGMKYRREFYEESDKKAFDDYIMNTEKLDPQVVKDMVAKVTTDVTLQYKFYNAAQVDDRVTIIKLSTEL